MEYVVEIDIATIEVGSMKIDHAIVTTVMPEDRGIRHDVGLQRPGDLTDDDGEEGPVGERADVAEPHAAPAGVRSHAQTRALPEEQQDERLQLMPRGRGAAEHGDLGRSQSETCLRAAEQARNTPNPAIDTNC